MKLIKYTTFVALMISSASAQAYIDPGSGSFLLQMLFASLIGAGLTLKMYYRALKDKMKRLFSTKVEDATQEENKDL